MRRRRREGSEGGKGLATGKRRSRPDGTTVSYNDPSAPPPPPAEADPVPVPIPRAAAPASAPVMAAIFCAVVVSPASSEARPACHDAGRVVGPALAVSEPAEPMRWDANAVADDAESGPPALPCRPRLGPARAVSGRMWTSACDAAAEAAGTRRGAAVGLCGGRGGSAAPTPSSGTAAAPPSRTPAWRRFSRTLAALAFALAPAVTALKFIRAMDGTREGGGATRTKGRPAPPPPHHLQHREARVGVGLEEAADEVLRGGGDVRPRGVGEVVLAGPRALLQRVVAPGARRVEGVHAGEEDEEEDADGPRVDTRGVGRAARPDLGRRVRPGAADRLHQDRGRGRGRGGPVPLALHSRPVVVVVVVIVVLLVLVLVDVREPEVAEADVRPVIVRPGLPHQEDVLRLDVAVDDAARVQEGEGRGEAEGDRSGGPL
jgi:hypothetical protein